eukprot:m.74065 g.74065  ORF g.74065 m.74065 type:complete len:612 (+) comp35875_c0_seq1:306-2141(+)
MEELTALSVPEWLDVPAVKSEGESRLVELNAADSLRDVLDGGIQVDLTMGDLTMGSTDVFEDNDEDEKACNMTSLHLSLDENALLGLKRHDPALLPEPFKVNVSFPVPQPNERYTKSLSFDDCALCDRQFREYSVPAPRTKPPTTGQTPYCFDCDVASQWTEREPPPPTPSSKRKESKSSSPVKLRSSSMSFRPLSLSLKEGSSPDVVKAKPATPSTPATPTAQPQQKLRPSPERRRPPPLVLRTQSCDARLLLLSRSGGAAIRSPISSNAPPGTPSAVRSAAAQSNGTIKVLLHSSPVFKRRAMPAKMKFPSKTPSSSLQTLPTLKRSRTVSTNSDGSTAGMTVGAKPQTPTGKEERKSEGLEKGQSTLVIFPPHEGDRPDHGGHSGKFPNLHPSMHPVLFLFVAPPAAAALAWSQYYGNESSDLSKACFFVSLFLFFSIIRHLMLFVKDTPYSLSYWAYTFPIAALATGAIDYANMQPNNNLAIWLAFGIVVVATILIFIVAGLTIYQIVAGKGLFPNDDVVGVCVNTQDSDGASDIVSEYSLSGSESDSYSSGSSCNESEDPSSPKWVRKKKRRQRREARKAAADTVIDMEPLQTNEATKLPVLETAL